MKDQDPVAVADGGETVGDDNAGTFHGVQGVRYLFLCDVVQGGCRLIKDQDPGFGRNGSGDHEALPLSAGDAAAALLEHGVHAHGHIPDIIGDACDLRGIPGILEFELGVGDHDIFIDTAGKEFSVLHDTADLPSYGPHVQGLGVLAVIIDAAALGLLKAKEQAHERGFAAAASSHQGHILAGRDLQAQVLKENSLVTVSWPSSISGLLSSRGRIRSMVGLMAAADTATEAREEKAVEI